MAKVGNGGKGIAWNTQTEVRQLGELNGAVTAEGVSQGMPRIETDIDAAEVVLLLAPETNGHVAVKAWEALGKQTGRDHTHLAVHREDEKIRFRDIQAQPRKIISSPTWSGIESETVSLQRRLYQRPRTDPLAHADRAPAVLPWTTRGCCAFGEGFTSYRPPVDLKTTAGIHGIKPNGNPEIALNFITPHQKWGIHSTYTDNLLMLTLSRGGPCVWLSEDDAEARRHRRQRLDRAVQPQRRDRRARGGEPARQARHGDDVPRAGKDRQHAGIRNHRRARRHPQLGDAHRAEAHAHDRRLRAVELRLQLLRDDRHQPRRVRRRAQDGQGRLARHAGRRRARRPCRPREKSHEDPRADRHGAQPGQVHRLPHLLGDLQERLDQPPRHGIRLVQQRRDQARHRLPEGMGEPGQVERRLGAQGGRRDRAAPGRQVEAADAHLRQPQPAADRRLLRALHLRLRATCSRRRRCRRADGAAAQPDHRPADGQDRLGSELGGDPRRRVRQAQQGPQLRRHPEGHLRPVREHLHDVPAAAVRALPESGLRRVAAPRARSTSARKTASC